MSFKNVNPALTIFVGFILWFLAEIPAMILGFLFHAAFNMYWYYGFLAISLIVLYWLSALRLGGWKAVPYLFVGFIIAVVVSYIVAAWIVGVVFA